MYNVTLGEEVKHNTFQYLQLTLINKLGFLAIRVHFFYLT